MSVVLKFAHVLYSIAIPTNTCVVKYTYQHLKQTEKFLHVNYRPHWGWMPIQEL